MDSKKWKNKNFGVALIHSLNGIKYAFQKERNLKIQLIFTIFVIALAIFLKLTAIEWMILSLTIGIVLFAEVVNTAIEKVLDVYSQDYNENIKLAKDIASGAVLLASMLSVLIGCILFLPKL